MSEHKVITYPDRYVVMLGTVSKAIFYNLNDALLWCKFLNGDKKIVDTTLWDDFLDFMDGTYEEEED